MEKNKDLISLNSKVLNEASIEELEERLELAAAWVADKCPTHGCEYVFDNPPPEQEL